MRRKVARILLITIPLLALFLLPPGSFATVDISPLCEKHGIKGEDLTRLKGLYGEVVESGVSEEELYRFFDDIISYGLDCRQLSRVLEKTLRLKKEGLPYRPVFRKVREGMAKGVPPGKVVDVTLTWGKLLEEAAGVVRALEEKGFSVSDREGAVILVAGYLSRGYLPDEIVERVVTRGVKYAGFSGLEAFLGQGGQR
ncbi:MAG: hypothetical protein D6713_10885 [Deltaproteobacteria bacterium]|nr:MAG: hypothetical protein D6713_10885 [Deltaproteobacteria bacterium]